MMDSLPSNYSEQDLRNFFDLHASNIDDDTNPLNLTNINSNYHDVHDILSDNFRNINFHCRVLPLNIQGLEKKFDNLKNIMIISYYVKPP